MTALRASLATLSALACLIWCGAVAAEPTATDSAAAEAAFERALALMDQKQYAQACPKLEESQRLDPAVGTLLYLADCYEQLGRTASAWATFREAAYRAQNEGQTERVRTSNQNAERLEPTLSKLTIVVSTPVAGLRVTRDGAVVGQGLWRMPTPVDPGSHDISATAPGKKAWAATVNVPSSGASELVTIPELDDAPVEQAPEISTTAAPTTTPARHASSPRVDAPAGSGRRSLGWVVTGVGGAALVGSGVFALLALGKDNDADAHCRPSNPELCDSTGVSLGNDADRFALVSSITLAAGAGLAATGLTLVLTAPAPDRGSAQRTTSLRVRLEPSSVAETASVFVEGTW